MSTFPLEVKALIVHEIAHGHNNEKTLSAVNHVWPETIREHRFKNLDLYDSESLVRLLPVITNAPALRSIINSISITSITSFSEDSPFELFQNLIALVIKAPNLEELSVGEVDISEFNQVLAKIPSSLYLFIKLKKFAAHFSYIPSLSDILDILSVFPHLTTLMLNRVVISEFNPIAGQVWDLGSVDPSELRPEHYAIWHTRHFKAPEQVPQVISLNLSITSPSDLLFLDLLTSTKTPFPNLEEITFVDEEFAGCRPRRLPALLGRYKTLRVLDLPVADNDNETPVLTLPSTVKHFKFAVSNGTSLDNFSKTLSSSALRHVSINFQDCYYLEPPPDTVSLDKVLVDMPELEQLELKVFLHMKKAVEDGFPGCLGKQAEGRLTLVWHVRKLDVDDAATAP